MNQPTRFAIVIMYVSLLLACSASEPDTRQMLAIPAHFPTPVDRSNRNPLTKAGIELGRRLFYDPILSKRYNIACADCHRQSLAFSDGVALSTKGDSGSRLRRNSPPLINLAWAESLFWDGGASDLESQAYGPLMHPDEMGTDLSEVVKRLQADPEYVQAFHAAFGPIPIASAYIARALAQFQRSIVSAGAKYDKFMMGQVTLSAIERRGLALFQEKACASCHVPPLFTDGGYHNNGLDSVFGDDHEGIHQGRYRITNRRKDIGRFKTPTLRNIALTAPYMHDGRIETLDDVLEHYRTGIKDSETLDGRLRDKDHTGILMTEGEKAAMIAFLHTLTDPSLVTHWQYSAPMRSMPAYP